MQNDSESISLIFLDVNECDKGGYTCAVYLGEVCENYPGGYSCSCNEQLNLVRVNGTCVGEFTGRNG